jgi:hypothetical protein
VARAFTAQRDGRVTARLERYEVELLRGLVGDVVRIVTDEPPGNAAYARLFPDPSPDPAAAAELHGLIHDDLRDAKLAAARALLESLPDDGRVSLDPDAVEAWLTALNDVRLALGTVLGVTEEMAEAEPEDAALHAYQWLSFLQETLVDAASGALPARVDREV